MSECVLRNPAIQGTFASIQPPDERSDELRHELDDLLTSTLGHVTDVRIAARRGELSALDQVAAPLDQDLTDLQRFVSEHG